MTTPISGNLLVPLAYERRLAEAGVASLQALAAVRDVAPLSRATGIPEPRLAALVDEARERLGLKAPEAHAANGPVAVNAVSGEARVVLARGGRGARVVRGGDSVAGVPVVTLRLAESEEGALRAVSGDVIVLREKTAVARVRVAGTWIEGVPVFEERNEHGVVRETRVIVREILDR